MNEQKERTVMVEPLLDESQSRFTLFPIQYKNVWRDYKTMLSSFWLAEDLQLDKDKHDFEKLNDDEKHYLKKISKNETHQNHLFIYHITLFNWMR